MIRKKEFKSKPYITEEMVQVVADIVRSGEISGFSASDPDKLNGGYYVKELERKWAEVHNVKYAISVNSATSGLITALRALEVGSGDEVITTPFSFSASWTSIELVGATPVFADVDLETMCLSLTEVRNKMVDSVKAILPVYWNSNNSRWGSLTPHLKIIEDLAQAPSTPCQGDIGVYSLNQPKNIMCGEGGVICTDDDELDRRCRLIRNHGEVQDRNWPGYNFRLTEIQAAIASLQLDHLAWLNNIRHRNWLYLCEELREYQDILVPQLITNRETYSPYCVAFRWLREKRPVSHLVRHSNIGVKMEFEKEGIPVATGVNYLPVDLPNASRLQYEEYLGFFQIGWPNTTEDMDDIVKGFRKVIG